MLSLFLLSLFLLIVAGIQDKRRRGSQGAEASVGRVRRTNGKAKTIREWSKHLELWMCILVVFICCNCIVVC